MKHIAIAFAVSAYRALGACLKAAAILVLIGVGASRAEAQTFSALSFTGTGGAAPGQFAYGSLIVSGSTLYGMTVSGGSNGGNVFSLGVDGTAFQSLLSFTGSGGAASGYSPFGSLILRGGTLYGMTSQGGSNGDGTVFSVGVNGIGFQNLVSFTGTEGAELGESPYGSLILSGTTLYGMTERGGNNFPLLGMGNIFSVGIDGSGYHNLLVFAGSGGGSGAYPYGSLIMSGTTLYGETIGGGSNGCGNVFSVGVDGSGYQNLLSFTGSAGAAPGKNPFGSLILIGSALYGITTPNTGEGGYLFRVGVDGSGFQNIWSFTGGTAGDAVGGLPLSQGLILSGTALYGVTPSGGNGDGNIFSVGLDGSGYQNLYSFNGPSDGSQPCGALTLSGGTLFGMAAFGGAHGIGTIFSLAGAVAPTPEPGTLGLVGTGAAALVSYRWRRRVGKR